MKRKVAYNTEYGCFSLSRTALCEYALRKYKPEEIANLNDVKKHDVSFIQLNNGKTIYDHNIPRHDPILIEVIEEIEFEMGTDIEICEVEGLYRIEDYDGVETVWDSAEIAEGNGWY